MNSKLSNITQKWVDILKPFSNNYSQKITASKLNKLTKIPQQTISRVLNELVKLNLIKFETSGKNKYYYFNLELNQSKIIIEMIELKKSIDFILNKPQINIIIEEILENADSCILFGSYSNYKDKNDSDLDIIIINGNDKKLQKIKNKNNIEINYENINLEELKKSIKEKNPLAIEIRNKHIFFKNVSKLVEIFIK